MISSRVALAFIFAAAVHASFADASPLRFRRRLGELQDGADLMDGIVEVDQELQDGTVLVEGVEEDGHNSSGCKSGDESKTCKTDYEKIDAEGLMGSDAKGVCAIIGQGWTVCTLGQLCPSNPAGTVTDPTLPAEELTEKYGPFPFFGDVYAPFRSGGACTNGGSVQMGTGDFSGTVLGLCVTSGCGGSTTNSGVICCGCEKTRGVQTDPDTKPPETPEHMYDCGPTGPTPSPTGTS